MVTYGPSYGHLWGLKWSTTGPHLNIYTHIYSTYSKYPTQPTMVETPHTHAHTHTHTTGCIHDIQLEFTQLTWGVQPSCWVLESGYGVQHGPVWLIVGDDLRNTTRILSDGSLKVFWDNTIFIHSNWRR